ncbi:unnamed protein product [Rotaria sordida]|uniref:Uncharacterized protein n=1 Tax=Rotaria sordida TaxID=392033 RepID=A0A815B706_9BILA|nr:unnamed protein product [Rotaria sordida]CAF1266717.1 unnamed protein product [Rotaria sordida]CAF1282005.1 unnamed protein product [Rotaria sordida]CAF3669376.1 unnamed protein product [Rotaria sordida]CAF3878875.1 unnamed protein product [Rotaria sordida]
MLTEIDCRAGKKGQEGDGRKGGRYDSSGLPGVNGRGGVYRSRGISGQLGSKGATGSDGCAAIDADDNILETGHDKYHASVCSYTITDENKDRIYESSSDFLLQMLNGRIMM